MEKLVTPKKLAGALATLPKEQTMELRSKFIPKACKIHFEKSPMKVTRAFEQYMYDDKGMEYLDCVNCVAHVGHCNPTVVTAAKNAMLQMGNVSLGMNDLASEYVSKLKATFPPGIDTFLFVSSGSEANDLAIQMARLYTGGYDVVSVARSFHGGLSVTNYVSPRQFTNEEKCPDWVHVLQCPDLYRGRHRDLSLDAHVAIEKYCKAARQLMENAVENKKRKLSCFIYEPLQVVAGVIIPPSKWLHSVYQDIRSFGGLVIADEAQSGLGRCGASMWGFQMFEKLIPDIITIGKPLGNGHPMACIATRSSIASKLVSPGSNEYACDLVCAAVGLAVLNTIRSRSLQLNARTVGEFLREALRAMAGHYRNIGQVRGAGLMIGVEIVYSQVSRKPARELAERICYKMLEHFIVVANGGIHKNVLIFTPPMCFTCENAHRTVIALGKVLKEIEYDTDAEETTSSSSGGLVSSLLPIGVSGDMILSLDDFVGFDEPGHDQLVRSSDGESSSGNSSSRSFSELEVGVGGIPTFSRPRPTAWEDTIIKEEDVAVYNPNSYSAMD